MNKKWLIIVILFCVLAPGLKAELLSEIGEVDMDTINTLKGHWALEDSRYALSFTDQFACKIGGLNYYYYTRSNAHTSYPWVYTVVRSKKTKQLYFARGSYQNQRFIGNTSKLEVDTVNNIVVYSSTDARKVYFKANRIKPVEKKRTPKSK